MNYKYKDILIILVASLLIGLFRFFFIQDIALIKAPNPEIIFISTSESFEAFSDKKSLFIDARDTVSYFEGHIENAINIDWENQLEDQFAALDIIPKDTTLIIYCSGGNCTLGEDLADSLLKVGYINILLYEDGFPKWKENNYPVIKGK